MRASLHDYPDRLRKFLKLDAMPPGARRVVVGVVGGTLLLAGVTLIFLPGPAFLVIPLALALLATEFFWAKRYLRKAQELFESAKQRIQSK